MTMISFEVFLWSQLGLVTFFLLLMRIVTSDQRKQWEKLIGELTGRINDLQYEVECLDRCLTAWRTRENRERLLAITAGTFPEKKFTPVNLSNNVCQANIGNQLRAFNDTHHPVH